MAIEQAAGTQSTRFTWWLCGIALAGLVLRIAYVVSQQHLEVGGDGFHYLSRANLAADGKWFEFPYPPYGPDAHHPPLWTAVLSVVSIAGGTWKHFQYTAALVGTVGIVAIGLAGRQVAGRRVGLIAAAILAVYPGAWKYDRELLSEALLVPLIALLLLSVYRFKQRPSLVGTLVMSLLATLLALTRAEQAALLPLLVLPVVLTAYAVERRRRIRWLAAGAALSLALVAPWSIFNTARHEAPVLLSTGLGTTMAAGACDATFSGERLGHFDTPACVNTHFGELAGLDRSEVDLHMRGVALDYTREHLDRLPVVVLAREGRTFGLYRPFQEARLATGWSNSPSWVAYAWTVSYWVLLPLAILGAVMLRRRRVPLYPLLVEYIVVAMAAAATFGLIRYRAAVEVPLVILAAVGSDRAWRWLRARRGARHEEPAAADDDLQTVG